MGENCVWGSSACVDAMGGCCLLGVGVHCVIASEAKQATGMESFMILASRTVDCRAS